MTRIVQKRGVGVPKADQMETAELAVDIHSGTLYTKLSNNTVVPISGGGGGGEFVHIGDTPPSSPSEGQQWMEVPADGEATMWIYDGGKWLQHPSGKDGADGAPGADGNIADGASDGSQDGVIATWDSTADQWTPDSSLTINATGNVGVGTTPESFATLAVKGKAYFDLGTQDLVIAEDGDHVALQCGPNASGKFKIQTRRNSTYNDALVIDNAGNATFSGTITQSNPSGAYHVFADPGVYAWRVGQDTSHNLVIETPDQTVKALSITPNTGNATFSGTARFETFDNPLMLRNGEDVYSIGVEVADIAGVNSACVVYDTWQTHYFKNADPAHIREVIYCDGNATFSGAVAANHFIEPTGALGLFFSSSLMSVYPRNSTGPVVSGIDLGTSQYLFRNVYATNVRMASGTAIGTRDLIETLSTLRNATKDETTIKGLRDAIGNAVGGLIEKFEAMQSEAVTQEISDE